MGGWKMGGSEDGATRDPDLIFNVQRSTSINLVTDIIKDVRGWNNGWTRLPCTTGYSDELVGARSSDNRILALDIVMDSLYLPGSYWIVGIYTPVDVMSLARVLR